MPMKPKKDQDGGVAATADSAAADSAAADSAGAGGSGSAAATQAKPKAEKGTRAEELPPYHVVLLNDDDHSYEYVVEMLKAVCGHPEEMGFKLAKCVDTEGRAVVMTTHKEKAELKREQIHSYGTDPRVATCRGSMTAIIQAAEG